MRRLPGPAPVLVTVAVLAALWATNAGSVAFFSGGRAFDPLRPTGPDQSQLGRGQRSPKPEPPSDPNAGMGLINLLAYIMLGLFVIALVVFVVGAVRNTRQARPEHLHEAARSLDAFDAATVPAELLETTEQQLRAIQQGTPRNAIVACWWELERSSAATGFPRAASETSSEFTRRVLSRYLVDAAAIESLAALYREARFSIHEMSEEDRERAIAALEQILVGLRAGQARTVGTSSSRAVTGP